MISRIIKDEVGVISQSQRLRLITLTETLIILDITELNLIIVLLYIEQKKNGSHVFASSLTASNTKCVNLTCLPSNIKHCSHTRNDYL